LKAKEQMRIQMMEQYEKNFLENIDDRRRIVQLTYGESGFITFLEDLFEPVKDEDKTEGFNYYFLLKNIF
jgi:hypothetical protein